MAENRLFQMVYLLLERGKITAPELAERFEVSIRTIYRDIDKLSALAFLYTQHKEKVAVFLLRKILY